MASSQVFDTVKLSAEEFRRVGLLLAAPVPADVGSQRRSPRVPVGEHVEVFLRVVQQDGKDLHFRVRARNISSGGLAFLHGTALAFGQRCDVLVVNRKTRQGASVSAKAVRCRHVAGVIHEIGLQFDVPLSGEQVDACALDAAAVRGDEPPGETSGPPAKDAKAQG